METVPFTPDFIGALDLVLEAQEKPDGLNLACRYAPAVFRPDTIKRMTDYFVAVLQRLAENPARRLCDLPLNVEAVGNQLKLNRNVTKKDDLKDTSFPQLSGTQIERMGQAGSEFINGQQLLKVSSKRELEERIVRIWREVIGLDKVGVNDNFFEVGGHSFLMIEIRNKIGELLGKKISVLDLFRYPTIGSLTDYLTKENHD